MNMKTALVHDWLVTNAGAELTLNYLYQVYPSPIYTLFYNKNISTEDFLPGAEIHTSSLQGIPGILSHYRKFLSLFPMAVEEFNLNEYDIILSSSHCVAKGALTTGKQLHFCYIHSPVRYAWDMHFPYLDLMNFKGLKRRYARKVLHRFRTWDVISSNRVDYFLSNSQYIADRVKRVYNREANVLYPPVNIQDFSLTADKDDYYVAVSRLVQYKRMDIIIEAFKKMPDRKLVMIGGGPEEKKLKKLAAGCGNIEILGYQPFEEMKNAMEKAKAFIFAAEEDFGSLPVQAQACGTPVLAYGVGGARETVADGKTGLWYHSQDPETLVKTVREFEKRENHFDHTVIRKNAERFLFRHFKDKLEKFVNEKADEFFNRPVPGKNVL
jgi:glycosyltransferase involved in cell wall biosynthesis